LNGDEVDLALTLLDIVEPPQHPLSVLQKARRHVLASPSLVASEEMQLLESAGRQRLIFVSLHTSGLAIVLKGTIVVTVRPTL